LLSCGCGQARQPKTANENAVVETEQISETPPDNSENAPLSVVDIANGNSEEDFKEFLEKFGTDSLFQISRIVFPLKSLEYAWDGKGNQIRDSVVTYIINLENFRFERGFASTSKQIKIYGYEYPTESQIEAYMKEHSLKCSSEIPVRSTMRISDNTYFVHFFGIEICGREGFYFQKDDSGKWYLVEIDARST
jgi:hypothetical protein